jgi:hypothetical protein
MQCNESEDYNYGVKHYGDIKADCVDNDANDHDDQ